ncbi:hypothetical protein ANHYDRO_01266 [Anaerococcus hydrogenalis DSM 7454]|uniref:Uncharacterized protein n=1 Tax=Anaerococcus hydrogenalis DSM 7454 TaxID=561177 RepID=B6W9L1_9FIRM|nr:hypothetical protein ANHYDRO_01266 [Anaerococcus hydrogenalis DSM 7454]
MYAILFNENKKFKKFIKKCLESISWGIIIITEDKILLIVH